MTDRPSAERHDGDLIVVLDRLEYTTDDLLAAVDLIVRHSVFDPADGNMRVEGASWDRLIRTRNALQRARPHD